MGIGAEGRKSAIGVDTAAPMAAPAALEAVTRKSGPDNDASGGDGVGEHHKFTLAFVDRRGREWGGDFQSHVLTINEHVQVGLVRARLLAGVPVESVDPYTYQLTEMLAHLAVSLDMAPKWAADLQKVRDTHVLQAIYEEVVAHEARFHSSGAKDASDQGGAVPDPTS